MAEADKNAPPGGGAGGVGPGFHGIARNVFFVGLVSLFMDVSSEMVYPLVPLFLTGVLGVTLTTVGVIEGVAEATASLLKVFSGWLSDRLGRRRLLMGIGYGVSVVSRPVLAGAFSWGEVLAARFIDRVGKGIRTAPRDAIIADSAHHSRLGAAFGFHRAMDTVGAAMGPALAFALLSVFSGDLRLVFYASIVPGVMAVLVIVLFVRETGAGRAKGERAPAGGLRLSGLKSFDGRFKRYVAVIGVFSLANISDAFLILRAEVLGLDKGLIMAAYLLFNVVYAASATPMGFLADRVGLKRMVLSGLLFYSGLYAAVAFAYAPAHVWVVFALYGVYKGMSEGAQRAYLATLAPPGKKATAFGVYHTASGLMLLPASVVAGLLWDRLGPEAPFFYASVLSLAAAAFFFIFERGRKTAHGGAAA